MSKVEVSQIQHYSAAITALCSAHDRNAVSDLDFLQRAAHLARDLHTEVASKASEYAEQVERSLGLQVNHL